MMKSKKEPRRQSKSDRLTTSKKILYMSYLMTGILLVLFIERVVSGKDASDVAIALGLAFAELAVHTTVYSGKSKKENSLYIAYDMIDKLADKYGIENVVTLFDSVNRE